ncbi:MAG TPA: hypothetical protein DD435_11880 [Cyanobacteria bacterium UBA8530]|nr:hypothetical protein [Cyanobacteria bacterium UBA8530]
MIGNEDSIFSHFPFRDFSRRGGRVFLKGLSKMSGDEALELLVGLRTYQLTRLVRIRGEEKIHSLKEDLFSFAGQLMGRFDEKFSHQVETARKRFDWNVASLEQIAEEERARLKGLEPQEIRNQLRQELAAISGERFSPDEEVLERKMIAEIAEAYKIDTSFRSMEAVEKDIFSRFLRELADRIQNQLAQLKPEETTKVEEKLFESLSKMSESDRDIMKRELNLAELSERQVLNVIRTEGSSLVSRMVGEGQDGYGIYLTLTAATHAVFTTLMGISLPFAFYSAMATLVGFLLGPLGIALITVGGGSYFYKRAQREYNAQLLAFALVSLTVKEKWGQAEV